MATIKVTQVRSVIKTSDRQQRTMAALGLRRIGQTVELPDVPQTQGMIAQVQHLVKVEAA